MDRRVREFAEGHNLQVRDTIKQVKYVCCGMAGNRLASKVLIGDTGLKSGAMALKRRWGAGGTARSLLQGFDRIDSRQDAATRTRVPTSRNAQLSHLSTTEELCQNLRLTRPFEHAMKVLVAPVRIRRVMPRKRSS